MYNREVQIEECGVGSVDVVVTDREYKHGLPLAVCRFVIAEQEREGASTQETAKG